MDPNDRTPVSYGLNSKLVKGGDGRLVEQVWKVGGMYSPAIEKIVYWLQKASEVAVGRQKETIDALIAFYKSGDLKQFDKYSILWVGDTASKVDFVNGFIESYGDPLGYRGSWESMVNFRDEDATERTKNHLRSRPVVRGSFPVDDSSGKKR